jgi:predicted nucleic acid-binding protein
MARYKVTKQQLEMVVESFVTKNKKTVNKSVSEARLRQIEKIMETYDITEDELQEIWPFGGKKTPEEIAKELIAKGQKIVDSDRQANAIYNTIKRKESEYGENAADKYLMFIAQSNGDMLYATWDKNLKAPDDTIGFWIERGIQRAKQHNFGSGE